MGSAPCAFCQVVPSIPMPRRLSARPPMKTTERGEGPRAGSCWYRRKRHARAPSSRSRRRFKSSALRASAPHTGSRAHQTTPYPARRDPRHHNKQNKSARLAAHISPFQTFHKQLACATDPTLDSASSSCITCHHMLPSHALHIRFTSHAHQACDDAQASAIQRVPLHVECMHALTTTPMRVPLHVGTAGPHGGVNESLQVEVATGITG